MRRTTIRFTLLIVTAAIAADGSHSTSRAGKRQTAAGQRNRRPSISGTRGIGHRVAIGGAMTVENAADDFRSPQVSAGWFQRPYPYHLDYYRMRYHGSYAPYFGNLYGTPQVVTVPPYYGPYYQNYGGGDAYGEPVPYGVANGYEMPEGVVEGQAIAPVAPSSPLPTAPSNGETLPAPK